MSKDDVQQQSGPVIDLFKLVRLEGARPVPLEEEAPENWREVLGRFNKYLMRVVAGLPMFFATAIEGSTRVLRGATLPRETEARVFRAHAEADQREEMLQQEAVTSVSRDEGLGASLEERKLVLLLRELQEKGFRVHGQQRDDGLLIIGVVRPEIEDATLEAIEEIPEMDALLEASQEVKK